MATDSLAAGHEALARGAWEEARERFEAALEDGGSGEAAEGLGWAAYWLADAELTFSTRERAYRTYREEGDDGAAARVAAWLAADYFEFRGDEAVGRGWLERANRLLENVPRGADHGWVALHEATLEPDMERRLELAATATELGRELRIPDLEAVGLGSQGTALVSLGRVQEGLRLLDEGAALASGEEFELPISVGWTLCCMVSSCDNVGDFSRATQWSQAMRRFSERWGADQVLGVCRSSYGNVLATGGDWQAAERELVSAVDHFEAARPGMAAVGLVRLGLLRARQGRAEEARELFERASPHPLALVGLGSLALERGDPAEAADAAERVLRRLPPSNTLQRLPANELLVRARAALGDTDAAADAAAELGAAAAELGTPYMLGRARLAASELAWARGDHDEARRAAEDAIDSFSEGSAPYDCALARVELSRALAALGRGERAEAEANAAREIFERLGAVRDVATAQEAASGNGVGALTARELDVLRLVAQGLSDAEIAKQLVVSPHTVHRHVANVRVKLGLPSRAAAVAYAAREGLL